jgi:hypothetical protein
MTIRDTCNSCSGSSSHVWQAIAKKALVEPYDFLVRDFEKNHQNFIIQGSVEAIEWKLCTMYYELE